MMPLFDKQTRFDFDAPVAVAAPSEPKKRRSRFTVQVAFEEHLKADAIPHVIVDEARRAIFSSAPVADAFDFLIYSASGPNLLAYVLLAGRTPTDHQVVILQEWEKVFGKDFIGVFVLEPDWRVVTLADWLDTGLVRQQELVNIL